MLRSFVLLISASLFAESGGGEVLPQTGDRVEEPWGAATMKQTLVYVPFYLPSTPWTHLMHVLLLSLVNHNWGRGVSLLQSLSLHNM